MFSTPVPDITNLKARITYFIHLPMKMEPIVSSETSAIKTQTPGNYPKTNKLHLEHGESLKTRITDTLATITEDMLENMWREIDYRLDVLHATKGSHVGVY